MHATHATVPAGIEPIHAQSCATADAFGILSHCHEHILEKLAELERLGRGLASGGPADDSVLAGFCRVLAFLHTAIPLHSADEEESLFPRLRRLPAFRAATGSPVDVLEGEHREHAGLLARLELELMRGDAPAAGRAALTVVSAYREHIAIEEGVLFPVARELLGGTPELAAMTAEMRDRRRRAGLLSAC